MQSGGKRAARSQVEFSDRFLDPINGSIDKWIACTRPRSSSRTPHQEPEESQVAPAKPNAGFIGRDLVVTGEIGDLGPRVVFEGPIRHARVEISWEPVGEFDNGR